MRTTSYSFRALAAGLFACATIAFTSAAGAASSPMSVTVEAVGEELHTTVSLYVRAAQQRVWEVITDYENAPEFMRDLVESKVISRSGDTLRVFQKNQFRFGPFSVPVESVKDVRLTHPVRMESRLVSGSIRKYEARTELTPESGGTRIVYRSQAILGTGMSIVVGEGTVKRETEEQFKQLRSEILRREQVAAKQ